MNTNDFYKELFEKYALDEKKIKRNALKAAKTPAWQRAVSTHWKSAVGAAAAVAVTVGAVAYTVGNTGSSIDIESPDTLLSASQRLKAAEQNYYSSTDNETDDMINIYVSFLDHLKFSDMSVCFSALTDFEDIDIECLYLNDGTVVRGKEEIDTFAETKGSEACIAGAKVCAPAKAYRDIADLSKVYVAERGSDEINDDTFTPILLDDVDPFTEDYDIIVTTASAESTTTPFVFEAQPSVSESSTSAGTDITIDTTTEPDEDSEPDVSEYDDETGDDPEVTEPDEDSSDAPETAESETSETTADPEETPAVSETTAEITVASTEITPAPSIGLMTQIYQLNVENALETVLAGDYAVVLTRGEAYISKLGGLISDDGSVYKIDSPKLAYSDSGIVILTGCGSSKRRNTVLVLNTKTGKVSYKEAGERFGEAEIGTIHHSSDHKYFLKAVAGSATYMYELTIGGEEDIQFRPLFEYEGAVSPAGSKNGKLWFVGTDENMKNTLYSFDIQTGERKTICGFGTECKLRRSKNFGSFIITASAAESSDMASFVFDAATSSLIPVDIAGDAAITTEKGVIYIGFGGKNYTVSADGSLAETSASVSYINRPASIYGVISSDSEKVVVAESNSWTS